MQALPEKMKALVAYGPEEMRLEEVPVPRAKEGEIILKVEACGICAGDAKVHFAIDKHVWGEEGKPGFARPPFIPGHEFLGTIVEIGAKIRGGYQLGDRVTAEQIVPCGECKFCVSGQYWMCKRHDLFGFRGVTNGGMAEYVRLPKEARVYKVPKDMPLRKAILIEPYACAKHAVDNARILNEDVVVMSGVGTLGLGMIGAIKQKNPKCVVALDVKNERLELAKKFGADLCLNPQKDDLYGEISRLTDDYGCDVYIEATGHPASVIQGLNIIRSLGRFVEFSVFGMETSVDWTVIGNGKELTIYGAHLSPYCYDTVIEWLGNGKLPSEGVVSHILPMEGWKEAFEMVASGKNCLKVAFAP
jgi:2-desacetyl-2-hydroxyethyl bacteriochlorophyllide A dehydrogenase